jgi:hypothetical protein
MKEKTLLTYLFSSTIFGLTFVLCNAMDVVMPTMPTMPVVTPTVVTPNIPVIIQEVQASQPAPAPINVPAAEVITTQPGVVNVPVLNGGAGTQIVLPSVQETVVLPTVPQPTLESVMANPNCCDICCVPCEGGVTGVPVPTVIGTGTMTGEVVTSLGGGGGGGGGPVTTAGGPVGGGGGGPVGPYGGPVSSGPENYGMGGGVLPEMPNTGAGDEKLLYLALFVMVLLAGESVNFLSKNINWKKLNANRNIY